MTSFWNFLNNFISEDYLLINLRLMKKKCVFDIKFKNGFYFDVLEVLQNEIQQNYQEQKQSPWGGCKKDVL